MTTFPKSFCLTARLHRNFGEEEEAEATFSLYFSCSRFPLATDLGHLQKQTRKGCSYDLGLDEKNLYRCFTEKGTIKRRMRPTALHPVTFWMGVFPMATKQLHWKWSLNIASSFPSSIESGILNAIHEVRECKGKKAEKGKNWMLLDGELAKQR